MNLETARELIGKTITSVDVCYTLKPNDPAAFILIFDDGATLTVTAALDKNNAPIVVEVLTTGGMI